MGSITGLYVCPTCSRGLSFINTVNNISVCSCGEIWERKGENLERLVLPVIDHPDDYIQPGTTGNWNGKTFIVTGRFRAWFKETVFNYWTIDFGDDRPWYLGAGYGLYAVYEPMQTHTLDRHTLSLLKSSNTVLLDNNKSFELTRENQGVYLDIESTFYKPGGSYTLSTYEATCGAEKVEIFEYNQDEIKAYTVHSAEIAQLGLQHTRQIESTGKVFTCKACNTQTIVKTYPYARSWTCACDRRYSLQNTQQFKEEGKNIHGTTEVHLEIGTVLTFDDIAYVVIGFAWKQDTSDVSERWKEYTLYHKIHGYVFLNESEGHWMLLKEAIHTPSPEDARKQSFYYNHKEFELFLQYGSRILYAKGEFPDNVFNDTYAAKIRDFVAQPDIWSVEQHEKEGLTWFYGQYIDKSIIERQIDVKLPASIGIAPAQEKIKADSSTIIRATVLALIVLLLVQYGTDLSHRKKVILDMNYTLSDSTVSQTFITDTFELKKWKSNLEFEINAPVDNSWFELGATLINAKTGDEYSLEQGVEYYHGYTEGENWSEGDTREEAYLSSIPAGSYFLQISSNRDLSLMSTNAVRSFSIRVTNDSAMYRNFWIVVALLLTWPVVMLILNNYYEKKRWQASPYSKFTYED